MPDILTVNDAEYTVLQLLGKGKGGYSYLVTDGTKQRVLKQIHHEKSFPLDALSGAKEQGKSREIFPGTV